MEKGASKEPEDEKQLQKGKEEAFDEMAEDERQRNRRKMTAN